MSLDCRALLYEKEVYSIALFILQYCKTSCKFGSFLNRSETMKKSTPQMCSSNLHQKLNEFPLKGYCTML